MILHTENEAGKFKLYNAKRDNLPCPYCLLSTARLVDSPIQEGSFWGI